MHNFVCFSWRHVSQQNTVYYYFISNHFRLLELVESDLLYSMRLIVYPHPRNLSMHPYICSWTRCPIACQSPWQGGCSKAQVLGRGQHCNRMVLLLGTTTQKTTDLCGHLLHFSKHGKFSHVYDLSLPEGTSCYRKRTMKFPPTSAALQAAVWVDPPPPGSNGDGKGWILCHIVCLPACLLALSTEHNKHWQQLMKNPKILSNQLDFRWFDDALTLFWWWSDDELLHLSVRLTQWIRHIPLNCSI